MHGQRNIKLPSLWVIHSSQLIFNTEIAVFFFEIHTKHANTVCGQNVEVVEGKSGGK